MTASDSEGTGDTNTILNRDDPAESLVLMGMSPTGPIEIAKWRVDDNAAFRTAEGCIGCLSIDRKTINIHDAKTGNVRLQIPNPSYTLNGNSQLYEWEMFGTLTRFNDSFGTSHVYNTSTVLAAIAVYWIHGELWKIPVNFGTVFDTTKIIVLMPIATILCGLPILLRRVAENHRASRFALRQQALTLSRSLGPSPPSNFPISH